MFLPVPYLLSTVTPNIPYPEMDDSNILLPLFYIEKSQGCCHLPITGMPRPCDLSTFPFPWSASLTLF